MAIDPVCGMRVDERSAAGSLAHEGTRYYFCSATCFGKFKADPSGFMKREVAGPNSTAALLRPAAAEAGHSHAVAVAADVASVPAPVKSAKDLAKDPICGMMVDRATALRSDRKSVV